MPPCRLSTQTLPSPTQPQILPRYGNRSCGTQIDPKDGYDVGPMIRVRNEVPPVVPQLDQLLAQRLEIPMRIVEQGDGWVERRRRGLP